MLSKDCNFDSILDYFVLFSYRLTIFLFRKFGSLKTLSLYFYIKAQTICFQMQFEMHVTIDFVITISV